MGTLGGGVGCWLVQGKCVCGGGRGDCIGWLDKVWCVSLPSRLRSRTVDLRLAGAKISSPNTHIKSQLYNLSRCTVTRLVWRKSAQYYLKDLPYHKHSQTFTILLWYSTVTIPIFTTGNGHNQAGLHVNPQLWSLSNILCIHSWLETVNPLSNGHSLLPMNMPEPTSLIHWSIRTSVWVGSPLLAQGLTATHYLYLFWCYSYSTEGVFFWHPTRVCPKNSLGWVGGCKSRFKD